MIITILACSGFSLCVENMADETNTLDALCADLGVKSDLKIAGALLNATLLVAVHECLKAPA